MSDASSSAATHHDAHHGHRAGHHYTYQHHAIVGIGNPLLDISATVDQAFLDKYEVKVNNAILAEEKHVPMYAELVKNHQVEYIAGGATQNSIRVAQWMLQKKGATAYIGCIGKDTFGAELRKAATGDGVEVFYREDESTPTGTCAVLIHEKERSLIANLAAANKYSLDHLQSAQIWKVIENAQLYYSAGFFLTVSPPSLQAIAKHAAEHNKILAINLAAPFIPQFFSEPLLAVIPFADYIFGNETEAEAFGKKQNYEKTTPEEVAIKLSEYEKVNQKRKRIVVITQGSKSTIVATEGKITTFTVPAVDPKLIVDTNGAGDAFVGGFLSQLIQGHPIEKCVEAGHYAASKIIQVSGAKVIGVPDFA